MLGRYVFNDGLLYEDKNWQYVWLASAPTLFERCLEVAGRSTLLHGSQGRSAARGRDALDQREGFRKVGK